MQLYTSNATAARNVGQRDEKTILRELDQTFSSSIGNGARKVILSYMHPKVLPCLALPYLVLLLLKVGKFQNENMKSLHCLSKYERKIRKILP
jgi:hypothetical protein